MLPTLVIDLDGTVCQYSTYKHGEFGPVTPECKAFLEKMAKHFSLVLHTARGQDEHAMLAAHLERECVLSLFDRVICGKPIGMAYIDDRAIRFGGDWDDVVTQIKAAMH